VQYGLPGQLTLQIIEENGKPVENAEVEGYFGASYHGTTDSQGMYTIKGTSMDLHFAVTKIGYYDTDGIYDFSIRGPSDDSRKQGRWLPWNPTYKVLLRKKINPVGMYWRQMSVVLPTQGEPIGYDLLKGDFVVPYGKGDKADFVFTVHGEFIDYTNQQSSLTITFSNKGDGIKFLEAPAYNREYIGESQFKLPYYAPEDGYQDKWIYERIVLPDNKRAGFDQKDTQVVFFRVRTETDENGKITRALYGKIVGQIIGGLFKDKDIKPKVGFTYYLSPNGTRNMENDPEKDIELK
jgi:hypothetical protein